MLDLSNNIFCQRTINSFFFFRVLLFVGAALGLLLSALRCSVTGTLENFHLCTYTGFWIGFMIHARWGPRNNERARSRCNLIAVHIVSSSLTLLL